MSDILYFCSGNLCSDCWIIIGSWGAIPNIIDAPDKNRPIAIIIKLSNRKVLGPIKSLDNPQRNVPKDIKVTGLIILMHNGTTGDSKE